MKRLKLAVPFSECEHYPCDYVAMDALLGFYGYETPLIIHTEWFFLYERRDDGTINATSRSVSPGERLRQFGIRATQLRERDVDVAWRMVRARIKTGDPIAALMDTCHLETHYYPGLGHHSNHYVILAGFDDRLQTVHLVDPSWLVRFRGDLSLSDFKVAWKLESDPDYQWLELHPPDSRPTLQAPQLFNAIMRNIRLMLHSSVSTPESFVGLKALQVLSDDLVRWKELENDKARKCLQQLHSQLRDTIIERDGHGRFLRLIAEHLNEPTFARIGESLRKITQKWLVFRNLCFKAQTKALRQTIVRLHGRLLEINPLRKTLYWIWRRLCCLARSKLSKTSDAREPRSVS